MTDKRESNFGFAVMAFFFKFRDLFMPPREFLNEAGIKSGSHVLDFGCGPGSYSFAASRLVGKDGKVYALDIHPSAIKRVKRVAEKRGLSNIEAIYSDCSTGLEEGSVDFVLLYDIFHHLSDPDSVMKELNRIMKPNSILSFSDHHMKEEEILPEVTKGGLFKLLRKHKKTYSFIK